MTSSLSRVLQTLEMEPARLSSSDVERWLSPSPAWMNGTRVLTPAQPARSLPCPQCAGVGRVAPLAKSLMLVCPECGPTGIDGSSLQRWDIDVPALLALLSSTMNLRGPATELVTGRLWRWGTATWNGRSRETVFARNWRGHEANIFNEMDRRPAAMVVVPTEASVRRWPFAGSKVVLALESIILETGDGLVFETDQIAARFDDASADQRSRRTAPKKRSGRAAKIEKLVHEIQRHLNAARNHAADTRERTGSPRLLPRPTQAELARMTGLSESDVSRCLKDDSADVLRVLWETAADLNALVSWSGSIRPPVEVED